MADKPRKKNSIIGEPGKPNYQLWIIMGLMAFIFGISYFSNSNSAILKSYKAFERMALSGDVK